MASYPPPIVATTNIELFNNIAFPGREASSSALSSAEEQELVDMLEMALTRAPLNEAMYALSACFVVPMQQLPNPRSPPFYTLHPASPFASCKPPTVERFTDLIPFHNPHSAPSRTASFALTTSMADLILFYQLPESVTNPAFTVPDDGALCGVVISDTELCRKEVFALFDDESPDYCSHVARDQRTCPWVGCRLCVHDDEAERLGPQATMDLLQMHLIIDHYMAVPRCKLCGMDLRQMPGLEACAPYTFPLAPHYISGCCLGLAKHAIEMGLPFSNNNMNILGHKRKVRTFNALPFVPKMCPLRACSFVVVNRVYVRGTKGERRASPLALMHNAHAQERERADLPSIEMLLTSAPLISSLGDALDRLRISTPKWRSPYPQIRRIPPEAAPFVQPRTCDIFLASRPTAIHESYFEKSCDLAILALPQTSPCHTIYLAGVPMQHILRLYELSWEDVKPTYAIPQSQSEVRCRAILPSGHLCGDTIQQHSQGDSQFKVHAYLHQRRCLWEGCGLTISDDVARQRTPEAIQTLLMMHMLLEHFQAETRCPLCQSVIPNPGVLIRKAHPLLDHYQTGSALSSGGVPTPVMQRPPVFYPEPPQPSAARARPLPQFAPTVNSPEDSISHISHWTPVPPPPTPTVPTTPLTHPPSATCRGRYPVFYISPAVEDMPCQALLNGEHYCGAPVKAHCKGWGKVEKHHALAFSTHVVHGQRYCPWDGCGFVFDSEEADRLGQLLMKLLLDKHVYAEHFKAMQLERHIVIKH
ncbi:hypothetical protein K523DRAFT_376997 [Schizophyllum commune Tattone D]|nr:hypothetical protein K523DRAFT_376997 [Schizophyllum commune Tattone D]